MKIVCIPKAFLPYKTCFVYSSGCLMFIHSPITVDELSRSKHAHLIDFKRDVNDIKVDMEVFHTIIV